MSQHFNAIWWRGGSDWDFNYCVAMSKIILDDIGNEDDLSAQEKLFENPLREFEHGLEKIYNWKRFFNKIHMIERMRRLILCERYKK